MASTLVRLVARPVRVTGSQGADCSSTALRRKERNLCRVQRVWEARMNVFQRQLLLEGKSLAELADLEGRRQPLDYYGSSAGTGSPEWRLPAIPRTPRDRQSGG